MQGQLAWITPVSASGERPDNSLPPGAPGVPTHPIELPPLPPGTHPSHPIALPPSGNYPSHPIFIPIEPSHPIAPGGEQPSHPIAPGGGRPARPDQGLPGSGETPTHPIALPPGTVWPPLNPGDGVTGKGWLLVVVVGADGYRKSKFVLVDLGAGIWPTPPVAEPK
jgi:hypothetical protein